MLVLMRNLLEGFKDGKKFGLESRIIIIQPARQPMSHFIFFRNAESCTYFCNSAWTIGEDHNILSGRVRIYSRIYSEVRSLICWMKLPAKILTLILIIYYLWKILLRDSFILQMENVTFSETIFNSKGNERNTSQDIESITVNGSISPRN